MTPQVFAGPGTTQAGAYIPATAEIQRLLESTTPSEQAWGAWLAAQARGFGLIPLIRQVADRYRAADDWRESAVASAALDALIQLQASVPAGWSRTFLEKWPAQTLILLSRAGGDAGPVLLDVARSQRGVRWLAAANLLLTRRTPGFAAHLLDDLEISAWVLITKDQSQLGGMGALDASVGHGGVGRLPDFPPLANYYLSSSANAGGVVLSPGPVTIYYFRDVSQPGETANPIWHDTTAPRPRHRLQYVSALLAPTGGLGLAEFESRSIVWTNQNALDAEVESLKTEIGRKFSSIVQQLVTRGLMTAEEAKATPPPKIAIQIKDNR